MKKIFIFSDGGLGNRLNSLVGGLIAAELTNALPVVCWPVNNWCGCKFDDLYFCTLSITNDTIGSIFLEDDKNYLIHENQSEKNLKKIFLHTQDSIEALKQEFDDIVYYHNKLPKYFTSEQIISSLRAIKIKKSVLAVVEDFCRDNSISRITKGIHLRKTDYGNQIDSEKTLQKIREDKFSKYFVCSDDELTEREFSELDNVITYPKTSYTQKLVEGDWTSKVIDGEGRTFHYNVLRSGQSVREAFIDLLILSRTKIITESREGFLGWRRKKNKSSFLQWAIIYSAIEKLQEFSE